MLIRVHPWLGVFSLPLLLAALNVSGQQAVLNATSIDTVLAQHQNAAYDLSPDKPHLGPVQLSFGLYAGTEYNDNVFAAQSSPQSDTLLRTGANLGMIWPATELSLVQFGAGVGYIHYFQNSQLGGVEVTPNSALTWQTRIKECTTTLYDQFSYQQQVTQEAAVANTATIPRLDNTVGARADWEPGQWVLLGDYSHEEFLSTESSNDYLSRSSDNFFARAGWRFAEKTQAGVEASAGLTSYPLPTQNDNQNFSVGAYADWQVTQNLHLNLRGGPTFYYFSTATGGTPTSDLTTYYVALNATHALTQFVSHQLSVTKDVSVGLEAGSSYVEQLSVNYSLTFALTEHISIGGRITYEDGNQPLLIPTPHAFTTAVLQTEDFSRYGFGPNVAWSFTDHFSAGFHYDFWRRTSNLPDRGYDQDIVSFQLNYNF